MVVTLIHPRRLHETALAVHRRAGVLGLARVPWAGHVWALQQQPLSEEMMLMRKME